MPHKFKLHRALILLWISLPLLDYAPGHAFTVAPTDTITTVYADINVTPLDLAVWAYTRYFVNTSYNSTALHKSVAVGPSNTVQYLNPTHRKRNNNRYHPLLYVTASNHKKAGCDLGHSAPMR